MSLLLRTFFHMTCTHHHLVLLCSIQDMGSLVDFVLSCVVYLLLRAYYLHYSILFCKVCMHYSSYLHYIWSPVCPTSTHLACGHIIICKPFISFFYSFLNVSELHSLFNMKSDSTIVLSIHARHTISSLSLIHSEYDQK